MTLTTFESIIIIITIAITTFFTRVIPFILFPDHKETPAYITYLGKALPYSAIGMLVIYCLKDISVDTFPFGFPAIISIIMIVIVHKWKSNTLLSIGGGTALYMILTQLLT